ncbi:MAG: hypothetical protein AAGA96_11890 [Verrucomicrobiota bacterium]
MSGKNTIHLVLTEFRRNLWFILIFWLQISLVPAMELTFLVSGLLTAHIAYTDHLTRATVQWKVRPVSVGDWVSSRLILLFCIFLVPVVVQQGISLHLTGFSASAIKWGILESVILMLLFVSVTFAFCSMAETWTAIGIFIASFLIFIFVAGSVWEGSNIGKRRSYYNDFDLQPTPYATWVEWAFLLFGTAVLFFVIYRFRYRAISIITLGLIYIAAICVRHGSDSLSRVYQPWWTDEGIYLSETPVTSHSSNQQPIYRNVVISGLPRGAFVDAMGVVAKDQNDKILHSAPSTSYTSYLVNTSESFFAARDGLIRSMPDEQRILIPASGQLQGDEQRKNRQLPIGVALEKSNVAKVTSDGFAFQWICIGDFRLAKGRHRLGEDLSVMIEDLGSLSSGPHSREFRFTFAGANLKFSPYLNHKRLPYRRQGPAHVAIVASHPRLKETIIFYVPQEKHYFGTHETLFKLDQQFTREVTIHADPKWRLIWPEGDLANRWLEEAQISFYTTRYLGRFNGNLELAGNP